MTHLPLEPGKFYGTRDGRKVRVYVDDGGGAWPVHGAIFDREASIWYFNMWARDGSWNKNEVDDTSDLDIVGPWVEPKPKRVAWITPVGTIHFTSKTVESPDWTRAPHLDFPEDE